MRQNRIVGGVLAAMSLAALVLHTTGSSAATRTTRVTTASALSPSVTPAGLKVVSTVSRDRIGADGTVQTRTWARYTKREVLQGRLAGSLGPTLALSLFRGDAPTLPPVDAVTTSVTATQVRGVPGWLAVRADGSVVLGWSEAANAHYQAIAAGGATQAQLRAFVDGLVAS